MEQPIQISKKALIAHLNDLRKRAVVDMEYLKVQGETKLVLVLADGSRETFKGLRAA